MMEDYYIKGNLIIKADHPNNTKRGGVCKYYKKYLPLIWKIDICKLNECIVTEMNVNNDRFFLHIFTDHQIKIKSSLSPLAKTS